VLASLIWNQFNKMELSICWRARLATRQGWDVINPQLCSPCDPLPTLWPHYGASSNRQNLHQPWPTGGSVTQPQALCSRASTPSALLASVAAPLLMHDTPPKLTLAAAAAQQDDLDVSPLTALGQLHLEDCKPRSISGLASLQQLAKLSLHQCLVLEALPGLEALHALTSLEVQHCQELRHMQLCASLVELRVGHCYSLATISTVTGGGPGPAAPVGPAALVHLEVTSCPRLQRLPCLRSVLPGLRCFRFSLRERVVQWQQGDRPGCCPWTAPQRMDVDQEL
jgi:hypothetical protein